uniref:Uncharacterized protein n=1 Tax=Tanacetum cinerariifolium TaxID=118510 RepID=A0A699GFQ2_TANCI|nr:hypothetical protein [Tanacetum cinerariifolium]
MRGSRALARCRPSAGGGGQPVAHAVFTEKPGRSSGGGTGGFPPAGRIAGTGTDGSHPHAPRRRRRRHPGVVAGAGRAAGAGRLRHRLHPRGAFARLSAQQTENRSVVRQRARRGDGCRWRHGGARAGRHLHHCHCPQPGPDGAGGRGGKRRPVRVLAAPRLRPVPGTLCARQRPAGPARRAQRFVRLTRPARPVVVEVRHVHHFADRVGRGGIEFLRHQHVVDGGVVALVDVGVAHVAQAVAAPLDLVAVEQASAQFLAFHAGAAGAHDDRGGDRVGRVVKIAQHDARAAAVAVHGRQQRAQRHGFGAAPDQRAQVRLRVDQRIFAAVAVAVVGPLRFQVDHQHVDNALVGQHHLGVQRRAGKTVEVDIGVGQGGAVGKQHVGGRGRGQRQAGHQRHLRREPRFARIGVGCGIESRQRGVAVARAVREHVAQGGHRKHFLQADHIGIELVELPGRPHDLGVVLLGRERGQIVVQFRAGLGKIANIESGKADFLRHNKKLPVEPIQKQRITHGQKRAHLRDPRHPAAAQAQGGVLRTSVRLRRPRRHQRVVARAGRGRAPRGQDPGDAGRGRQTDDRADARRLQGVHQEPGAQHRLQVGGAVQTRGRNAAQRLPDRRHEGLPGRHRAAGAGGPAAGPSRPLRTGRWQQSSGHRDPDRRRRQGLVGSLAGHAFPAATQRGRRHHRTGGHCRVPRSPVARVLPLRGRQGRGHRAGRAAGAESMAGPGHAGDLAGGSVRVSLFVAGGAGGGPVCAVLLWPAVRHRTAAAGRVRDERPADFPSQQKHRQPDGRQGKPHRQQEQGSGPGEKIKPLGAA